MLNETLEIPELIIVGLPSEAVCTVLNNGNQIKLSEFHYTDTRSFQYMLPDGNTHMVFVNGAGILDEVLSSNF